MSLQPNFKKLDLNLLKVLMVLIETQNTRKAAEALFTSQPSISRSLQKLREHFNDELFIRSQHGLEPTARLDELKSLLLPILGQLETAIEPRSELDLATLDASVNIAINGFIANTFSAPLTHMLLKEAPNIKINISAWQDQTIEQLISGDVDIGINYYPLNLSKQVYQKRIAQDGFVLVCRSGHRLANKMLDETLATEIQLASLVVPDWNELLPLAPRVIESLGIKADVKVRSSYLHSLLAIVKESDILFPCSKLLVNSLSNDFAFVDLPPMPNMPDGQIGMAVGRKHRNNPKMSWLQSCVERTFLSIETL
ncbi:LysR family transcriptional regulator [Vibrio astriarenae]